eukprot:7586110-Prorocentrum_lima.AAC.1
MSPQHMPAVRYGKRGDAGDCGRCSGGWGCGVHGRGRSVTVSAVANLEAATQSCILDHPTPSSCAAVL